MKGIRIITGLVFSMLISGLMAMSSTAQVIIAPLDPSDSVVMPGAAGWRDTQAVGFSYSERSGKRKLNNQDVYDFDSSGISGNGAFKIGNVAVDAYMSRKTTDASVSQYYEGPINISLDDSRFSIAMAGNDFVSVGLGGHVIASKDYFDATNDSQKNTETRIGGSVSIKAFEVLYFGGGFERVKYSSDFQVENVWNSASAGLALRTGQPGDTRFRLEFSVTAEPYEKSDAQGDLLSHEHQKSKLTRYAAELMINGLLFSLNATETRIELDSTITLYGEEVDTIIKNRGGAGVLWVPENGLVLGFYFGYDKTTSFYVDENSEFRINLGYTF